MASDEERHDISHNQFGNNTKIHQGNIHFHLPRLLGRAEVVRIIPYPRNEDLVYRRDLVNQLDILLPQAPGFYSAALWGLGGSGKTQIALEYAYRRCVGGECCVFWVHADSEATFAADYKIIGKKLGVDKRLVGLDLLDAVRSSIEAQSQWVIILDNADNLGLFGVGPVESTNGSLYRFIPRGPQGTILWTSRDAQIRGTLVGRSRDIPVPPMTKDEATTLLAAASGDKSSVDDADIKDIKRLLEELQQLPLAVSQAGAYMRRASITIKEYLDLLTQGTSRWDLLKSNDFDRHRRPEVSNSILETWKISIERIREESELSYHILHVIAYLDSQEIPHELIVAASQFKDGDEDKVKEVPELEVQRAVTRLVDFSFLDKRVGEEGLRSYAMHHLVQEALRYGLWVQGQIELTLGETAIGQNIRENRAAYYARMTLHIVDDIFPVSEQDSWGRCEQYMTHAIQVGEWAEVSGKKVEASALLTRVSDFLHDRGRWREKEPVDRRTLYLRREALGKKHPDTVKSMASLAATYHAQGRYNEAEKIYEQALTLQRELLGEKHPDTATSMASLAATYHAQGRYNKAKRLKKQALDIRQKVLGEKHPDSINSMASLAMIYHAKGRYNEAERLCKQASDLWQEVLGEKHPDSINSMASLAMIYHAQGRYNEAESIYEQALDLRRETLGEKHPDTIRGMASLAVTYHDQGRFDEAEKLKKQALDLRQEVLGEKHPDTIKSIASLAATTHEQGQFDEARRLCKQASDLWQEVLGEKHPDSINGMASLAMIYHAQGRYNEAESIYEQALDLRRETLGEKHPDTIRGMASLAATYHAQGRYNEAEKIYEQALTLQRELLGEKHPDTATSMASLAATYHAQGRYNKAKRLKKQALDIRQEVLGEKHPDTIRNMASLPRRTLRELLHLKPGIFGKGEL
ncbi:hypothetical protein TARUN_9953 [Trichoderma arundinaceum]|uniref:Uncharacterized protein n=1 Tax=Trichoderma arundinaceum TaxID=490622 RepID=A0A395N936_TRIAR|nr:hypothetical protein TARUN_9953 [Trichoderma arundinaceum]